MKLKQAIRWEVMMIVFITITMWLWYLWDAPWSLLTHTIIYNVVVVILKSAGLWVYSRND